MLAQPATGAAWTSLANQADIILAEPGAKIGPGGRHAGVETARSAEDLLARGMLDGIVDRTRLCETRPGLLALFADRGKCRPLSRE